MKKIISLLLVTMMVISLVACGGTETASSTTTAVEPTKKEAKDYKVVGLLSGVITDNGWNQSCYEALMELNKSFGVNVEYLENIAVSDMEEQIRAYGAEKYDMVIVHGSQFQTVAEDCAGDYPDTKFCLSYGFKVGKNNETSVKIKDLPNLAYVGPVDMGVAVRGIMGILTETNKVVFLGGQDIPAITDCVSGVKPGVVLTNPDCQVETNYIGTLTDADLAKEMTFTYLDNGFDVVSASANSAQLGCLHAAEERGKYALGFLGDQYSVAPNAVVISVMRNYSSIYKDVFQSLIDGNWKNGPVIYGLKDNGTKVSDWHGWDQKLPKEKVDKINQFITDLFNGKYEGKY